MESERYTTRIGHVHLRVRDLDLSTAFYMYVFSMQITERVGDQFVFLTGGEAHHEIALERAAPNADPAPQEGLGVYHIAFQVPDKVSFARAYKTLIEAGIPVATVDQCVCWTMYFPDPDGNQLEIYWDERGEPDGVKHWRGINLPLEAEDILAVLENQTEKTREGQETDLK